MSDITECLLYPTYRGFNDQTDLGLDVLKYIDTLSGFGVLGLIAHVALRGEGGLLGITAVSSSILLARTGISYLVGRVAGYGSQVFYNEK